MWRNTRFRGCRALRDSDHRRQSKGSLGQGQEGERKAGVRKGRISQAKRADRTRSLDLLASELHSEYKTNLVRYWLQMIHLGITLSLPVYPPFAGTIHWRS